MESLKRLGEMEKKSVPSGENMPAQAKTTLSGAKVVHETLGTLVRAAGKPEKLLESEELVPFLREKSVVTQVRTKLSCGQSNRINETRLWWNILSF